MEHQIIDRRPSGSYARRTLSVLKAWIKKPGQVATICPSSPRLTRELACRESIRAADRIIELGPGAGGTTMALLSQMHPEARLLAIEKTPELAAALKQIDDPRLIRHCGDAASLIKIAERYDFRSADVVISGIPFSILPKRVGQDIVAAVHHLLRPGGEFVAYQLHDDVTTYADPRFGNPKTKLVPLNLPPLKVYSWTKAAAAEVADQVP